MVAVSTVYTLPVPSSVQSIVTLATGRRKQRLCLLYDYTNYTYPLIKVDHNRNASTVTVISNPTGIAVGPNGTIYYSTAPDYTWQYQGGDPWPIYQGTLNQPAAIKKVAPGGAVSTVCTLPDPASVLGGIQGYADSVPSFGPFLAADSANNVFALPIDLCGDPTITPPIRS